MKANISKWISHRLFYINCLIALFFNICLKAQTQQDSIKETRPKIHVIAKVTTKGIVLRWAPTTAGAWYLSNKYGYRIDKTYIAEGKGFNPDYFEPVTKDTIKPWSLDKWATICPPKTTDTIAAVAAQMILQYDSIKPEISKIRRGETFKTFYSYALFAADISPNAAEASGLRYVDTAEILPKHTYIYRIYSLGSSKEYPIDTGYIVISANEPTLIQPLKIAHIAELEHLVQLHWSRKEFSTSYTAYYIERSDNGKNFKRLTNTPYISSGLESDLEKYPNFIYTDSLKENYRPYHYRIIGITPFGDLSQPSDTIIAMARDRTPPPQPQKVNATYIGNGQVKITWEYNNLTPPDFKGFYIGHSLGNSDSPKPLTINPLPSTTRTYIHQNADTTQSNFYIIAAADTAGNGSVSLSAYAPIIDSFPPTPPMGMTGKIDTNGIVTLNWKMGKEPDIMGYHIFYSHDKNHVFTKLNKDIVRDTFFRDTVMVRSLTEDIYYTFVAVDVSFNHSEFSDSLRLIKPDIVPPVAPILKDYEISPKMVKLTWIPSSSKDVVVHVLYRKKAIDTAWQVLFKIPIVQKDKPLIDSTFENGQKVNYLLEAVDDAQLKTKSPYYLTFVTPEKPLDIVQNLKISSEKEGIQLKWDYSKKEGVQFIIYRSINKGSFRTYKKVDTRNFIDTNAKKGQSYEYAIKAIHNSDNKISDFSSTVEMTHQ